MADNDYAESAYLAWIAKCRAPAEPVRVLLEEYDSGKEIYRALRAGDERIREILPEPVYERLRRSGEEEELRGYRELMENHGIRCMTLQDPAFPEVLREIQDPVSILFYQGETSCLRERKISMVGSRRASYAGLKAAEQTAGDLSREGVCVISGFAVGIDGASHRGCLKGRSATIAVMGCGLDQNYPADHAGLRREIIENGGMMLSEYAPGEKPLSVNFPYRNRIISALGEALVLMEARIRSGSLRTVDHALKQGKDVFVYPGDPASPFYEGNHMLLRDGARYFTTARDILEDMNWLDKRPRDVQNSGCTDAPGKDSPAEAEIRKLLGPGELSFDQLASRSGMDPAALLSILTMMQIRGVLEALPGKKYRIKP